MRIEEDPILGEFFDTPEKKARWMRLISRLLILWLVFVVIGFIFVTIRYFW